MDRTSESLKGSNEDLLGLEQFRDILQICPKVGNKKFVDPPLEKEILIFLASLGHSGDIRKLTDVNVNKLHQPWRSFAAVINKCLSGTPSYDSLRLSQAQILWGMYNKKNVDYAYLLWEDFIFKIENYPRFTKLVINYVMEKDPSIPRRNKVYARASGTIPPKTKGSKKKATTDIITQQKPPTAPKKKNHKRSRSRKLHKLHASGSGADEGTGVTPGVPDAPDYDSEDDISWKSSDDDQDDEQDQDDEGAGKHDVNETTQDEEDDDDHDNDEKVEDDDVHDDDENAQEDDDEHDDDKKADDDDDEELTESDEDGDEFVHPKLTTLEMIIILKRRLMMDDTSIFIIADEEDSDNDVEGANVASAKSDEDATDEKDQGNEAVKDTNTDLDGRDKVMTDVEDTHVTLTPVNL
ncbi:hypothetical protein Tco_0849204 [Tanacetum coccineum]